MTTQERVQEIVNYERAAGRDPVEAVQDYFAEKDSRFTRSEIKKLIERAEVKSQLKGN